PRREAGVVAGPAMADHELRHVLSVLRPAFRDVHVAEPLALQVPHPAGDDLARDAAAQGRRRVVERLPAPPAAIAVGAALRRIDAPDAEAIGFDVEGNAVHDGGLSRDLVALAQ